MRWHSEPPPALGASVNCVALLEAHVALTALPDKDRHRLRVQAGQVPSSQRGDEGISKSMHFRTEQRYAPWHGCFGPYTSAAGCKWVKEVVGF